MNNFDIISQTLSDNDILLEEHQISQLEQYYNLLIEYNQIMNLTNITNIFEASLKHFVDSLFHVKHYKDNSTILDIGTGAGFPGLPIAIARPSIKVTLVDSINKRIEFLNVVINKLQLTNVTTHHSRAQEFCTKTNREQYDYCIARAVAPMNILAELCLPFVKQNGEFIAYKSVNIKDELESSENAINILGGMVTEQTLYRMNTHTINKNNPNELEYFDTIERDIITITKIKQTPARYPRIKNLIKTKPL